MAKTNKKRIFSAISFVVSLAIFVFALSVFISTLKARSQNRPTELFGYSFAVVVTGSMSPEIEIGDLIIVKSCDITSIQEGQNAVYMGYSGEYKGKCIVHRVVRRVEADESESGEFELITKGLLPTSVEDPPVTAEYFIGREVFHSSMLGTIMIFIQNPINWVYVIVIVGCIFVFVTQIKKIIKHAKAKEVAEGSEAQADKPDSENKDKNE